MAVEIERKFLVLNDDWRASVSYAQDFRQGYLNNEVRCSIRVRTTGDQAWLNIKSVTIGAQRQEFEYAIPVEEGNTMLDTLALRPFIEKRRHFIENGQHTWEVDEFFGDNAGLVVAEIELDNPDEDFARPAWLGQEVTDDIRYYNTSLCHQPYKEWTAASTGGDKP